MKCFWGWNSVLYHCVHDMVTFTYKIDVDRQCVMKTVPLRRTKRTQSRRTRRYKKKRLLRNIQISKNLISHHGVVTWERTQHHSDGGAMILRTRTKRGIYDDISNAQLNHMIVAALFHKIIALSRKLSESEECSHNTHNRSRIKALKSTKSPRPTDTTTSLLLTLFFFWPHNSNARTHLDRSIDHYHLADFDRCTNYILHRTLIIIDFRLYNLGTRINTIILR